MQKQKHYHSITKKLIIEEKTELERTQRDLKSTIARISKSDPYGSAASTLMKLSNKVRIQVNDLELALKVLKQDGQRRNQQDWEQRQAKERLNREGSYNCLGGC